MPFFKSHKKPRDANPLRIITLSGTEGVTKNLTVYEYADDIIAVDCGIGFPDSEMLGVDVVIPDMTYLVENAHRIKGLFLTHAHEDHIGAVPYFVKEFPQVPIYTGKLVQGLLREKLDEKRFKSIAKNVKFNLISPESGEIDLGNFKVSAFRLNHSVPSSMGFAIRTPQGLVLHAADFKIDWTPVLDKPADLGTLALYGKDGVLCLLSDCLGVTTDGYSQSEIDLDETFEELFERAQGRQFLVTTISSNISRMYQIINGAIKHHRKVVLTGRSIRQTVKVALGLGYLDFDMDVFVEEEAVDRYLQKDLVYIIAGCYGQDGSALERLSRKEHEDIVLEENALVVFSADPNPPGVEEAVERVMDNLTLQGAEVVYSKIQENLHVSGHGTKGDLRLVAALVKPKYFIPIGGTITRMRAYTNMVQELGVRKEQVFEQLEGESVEFVNGFARKGETIPTKPVFVDGSSVGEVGPAVMKDREHLSGDGVFVVVVPIRKSDNTIAGRVEVITRGFVYVKESRSLLGRSRDVVNKTLDRAQGRVKDWSKLRARVEKDIERFLLKETGRMPLIIVQAVWV